MFHSYLLFSFQDVEGGSEALLLDLLNPNVSCHSASPTEIKSIQYSKLLININNSVCALSNKPLREELMIRGYRVVLAAAVLEGVRVCQAANIPLTRVGGIRPAISPYILVLPTFIYGVIAKTILKLGGDVYSSMWEDLHRKKPTEIDYINGEIVSLAKKLGMSTPVNDSLIALVRKCEVDGSIPSYSPEELLLLTNASKYAPSPIIPLAVLAAILALPIYLILLAIV
jgi:ketopantoate reductase